MCVSCENSLNPIQVIEDKITKEKTYKGTIITGLENDLGIIDQTKLNRGKVVKDLKERGMIAPDVQVTSETIILVDKTNEAKVVYELRHSDPTKPVIIVDVDENVIGEYDSNTDGISSFICS